MAPLPTTVRPLFAVLLPYKLGPLSPFEFDTKRISFRKIRTSMKIADFVPTKRSYRIMKGFEHAFSNFLLCNFKKVTRAQNGILGQSILGAYLAIAHGSNFQHLREILNSS
jgi:hypothetical protein